MTANERGKMASVTQAMVNCKDTSVETAATGFPDEIQCFPKLPLFLFGWWQMMFEQTIKLNKRL